MTNQVYICFVCVYICAVSKRKVNQTIDVAQRDVTAKTSQNSSQLLKLKPLRITDCI